MNILILKRAIETFGKDAQIEMAVEEMAELIFAIQKLKRAGSWSDANTFAQLTEEMADVKIMLQQLEMIFGNQHMVDQFVDMKIERLNERINKAQSND